MKLKRFIVNCITLVRLPVIVLLAFVVSPDEPLVALGLYAGGLISHALDGTLAKLLGVESEHSGFWHEMDTAYLSLGLQLAAAVWLVRADVFPWWVIPIYLAVTFALEFGYVQPRKKIRMPFVPVVLYGSAVVWLALAVLISAQDNARTVVLAVVVVMMLAILHATWHGKIWDHWAKERHGYPPRTGW